MKSCAFAHCNNNPKKNSDKHFFAILPNDKRRDAWIKAIKKEYLSKNTTIAVCEDHFNLEEDVVNIMKYRLGYTKRLELRPDVVPHRCLEGDKNQPPAKKRQERLLDQAEESVTEDEMPKVKDEPIWLTEDGPTSSEASQEQPPLLSDRQDYLMERSRKRKAYEDISDQDPFDVFGRHVANKLRIFSREQNALAQRLISEVLFEGEMGGLNRRVRLEGCSGWKGPETEHIGEFVAVKEEELGLQPE